MLRDAIWALLGTSSSGSQFCHLGELQKSSIVNHLHPAEEELCQKIAAIGNCYLTIKNSIENIFSGRHMLNDSRNTSTSEKTNGMNNEQPHGFYILAFCEEVNVLLKPYYQEISALEQQAIRNPETLTLLGVYLKADRYTELFYVLARIFETIHSQKIHGCALLNLLLTYRNRGVGTVEYAVNCLIHKLQILMVNQLSKWVIYGNLDDVHKEFFIQSSEIAQLNTTAGDWFQEDITHKRNSKGLDWSAHLQYKIEGALLPIYIKPSLASKILYVGKMLRIFGRDPEIVRKMGIAEKHNVFTVWAKKQEEYFCRLQKIQTCRPGPLNIMSLQKIVNNLRGEVMKHMWQLIKEDARLLEEVELMKDIFMLGRGELFQKLLDETEGLRQQPYSRSTNRDMEAAFKMAVHKILPNDETVADKFHFSCELPEGSDEDVFKDKDGWWHFMSVKYTVKWPLQLMFKPIILDNYNIIFKFLFRLKKALIDVQRVWQAQMKTKRCFGLGNRPSKFWQLQNNLLYLLNNIQYYMQVCVLEPLYKNLQLRIQKCTDIEEIVEAHIYFQTKVMSHFFLTMRSVPESRFEDAEEFIAPVPQTNPVHRSIMLILQVSEKFCKMSKLSDEEWTDNVKIMFDEVFSKFQHSLSFFMNLLTCAEDRQLYQLCVMLDFNEQFSFMHAPYTNNSVNVSVPKKAGK